MRVQRFDRDIEILTDFPRVSELSALDERICGCGELFDCLGSISCEVQMFRHSDFVLHILKVYSPPTPYLTRGMVNM